MDMQKSFIEVVNLIENAKQNALQQVNTELISLYWNIGKYIHQNSANTKYGDRYIIDLAEYLKKENSSLKGFNYRSLYRMKKFYEVYPDEKILTTLLSKLSFSHHTKIIAKSKSKEEREFYLNLAIKERYSIRELERQMNSAYYERYMLSKNPPLPYISSAGDIQNKLLDNYVLEFLDLPDTISESDLKHAIVKNLKDFILEIGKDFSFIGEEYRVQVGEEDYHIDLLFYHRGLSCLVAFELKIDDFKPEYVSKIDFYLEALDRQVKKENENPSVGIILCAKKNDEVVEYALSRNLSPKLIADYNLKLIDKKILQNKLKQLMSLSENADMQ